MPGRGYGRLDLRLGRRPSQLHQAILLMAGLAAEALPFEAGDLPIGDRDDPLVVDGSSDYPEDPGEARALVLQFLDARSQKTPVLYAAPQPIDLDGLDIEDVVPNEIGGVIYRLEQQGVPERLLEAPRVERESRWRQRSEGLRDEVGST